MATVVRMVHDPATRAYAERKKAEGKTSREIRCFLKSYLARHLYRILNVVSHQSITVPAGGLTDIEDSDH